MSAYLVPRPWTRCTTCSYPEAIADPRCWQPCVCPDKRERRHAELTQGLTGGINQGKAVENAMADMQAARDGYNPNR